MTTSCPLLSTVFLHSPLSPPFSRLPNRIFSDFPSRSSPSFLPLHLIRSNRRYRIFSKLRPHDAGDGYPPPLSAGDSILLLCHSDFPSRSSPSFLPLHLIRSNRRYRIFSKLRPHDAGDGYPPPLSAVDSILLLCTSVALSFSLLSAPPADAFVVTTPRKLQSDELATVRLFQENTPSVVYITNLAVRQDAFTLDVLEVPQGSGSGFVWDKEGHIVTNYHVIRGASDLRVTLADQSTYDAKVVGFDQDKDVAVLRIDAPKDKLRPIPVGISADLLVGQKVFAIGNPFGLDHTLTTGVISGLRREISSAATGRPIQDVIQTDAAINPGNSGGPLLDSSGNLIGINTAIYSPSGASSGVGFSIPVDTVGGIVDQLVKFGKVTRPILGIKFAPDQSVEQLGVSGVLVLDAPPNGPAGKAGLQPTKRDSYGRLILGDIITSVNGKKVSNGSDLYRILDQCQVGDKVGRFFR
ncbi:PREDICTED: protease Do-like 1, chloroplastic isoform X2 [Tarenaya hassleriana]|uniref:protease Do-like 1, chloroplastic isoform X2 n=1 Tax=Tarenaya hassleriana TaxID=28532 RepID=UPI00053C4571|nr:PREDICTED: protease Do-like 1, chloroplastic isoform X2 [Tarenaya hassleriana]